MSAATPSTEGSTSTGGSFRSGDAPEAREAADTPEHLMMLLMMLMQPTHLMLTHLMSLDALMLLMLLMCVRYLQRLAVAEHQDMTSGSMLLRLLPLKDSLQQFEAVVLETRLTLLNLLENEVRLPLLRPKLKRSQFPLSFAESDTARF